MLLAAQSGLYTQVCNLSSYDCNNTVHQLLHINRKWLQTTTGSGSGNRKHEYSILVAERTWQRTCGLVVLLKAARSVGRSVGRRCVFSGIERERAGGRSSWATCHGWVHLCTSHCRTHHLSASLTLRARLLLLLLLIVIDSSRSRADVMEQYTPWLRNI